ncbi:MAG TPA: hypothetical protein VM925_17865 [Labilithrix sp.]|nr:hypothetical protein [Labilithrix sp.]
MRIVAKDPALVSGENRTIVTALVDVPREELDGGPRGHRAVVIDFNASTGKLYAPPSADELEAFRGGLTDAEILGNPRFHAQHTFAIVMRTLARFELALGRRVSWGFDGQQIKIAPHAFVGANAFYSRRDQALLFGYFRTEQKPVFACLAHDVVAHETTHALLDGLRERYMDLSHPDQAAFHEAFADIVALLSFFSLPDVVGQLLPPTAGSDASLIDEGELSIAALKKSALMALGEEMGLGMQRGGALRRSVELDPERARELSDESHDRGEILVAAVMNTFLAAWRDHLEPHFRRHPKLDRGRAIEVGTAVADRLLTTLIRALDYSPPVDVRFEDYLSAALTSSAELSPDDDKYRLRALLREQFARYGITPPDGATADGYWTPYDAQPHARALRYDRSHFDSLQRDPEEVFRFLWENRDALGLSSDAYTRVLSVRPCLRVDPDGFTLRETVAEYKQILHTTAGSLPRGVERPSSMPSDHELALHGGGVLVFDQFGRLKYHVYQHLVGKRQTARLHSLWEAGLLRSKKSVRQATAALHLERLYDVERNQPEVWS